MAHGDYHRTVVALVPIENSMMESSHPTHFVCDQMTLIHQDDSSEGEPAMNDTEEDQLVIDKKDWTIDVINSYTMEWSETPKCGESVEEGKNSMMKNYVHSPVQQHEDLNEAKECCQLKKLECRKEESIGLESISLVSISSLIDNEANHLTSFQANFCAVQNQVDKEGLDAPSNNCKNRSDTENEYQLKKKVTEYFCPICSRNYTTMWDMESHVLTHTSKTPFQCAHCPRAFSQKQSLKVHFLRIHAYTSPVSANSDSLPAIADSPTRKLRERPFGCCFCRKSSFSTLSKLKKHQSAKHPNLLPLSGDGAEAEPEFS